MQCKPIFKQEVYSWQDQLMSVKEKGIFFHSIIEWFEKNGKKYPWRNEKDSYRILIAEVMLQRTKTAQVIPVYREFIKKYPDIKSASKASEKDIQKYVGKLGLFWRSKRMKQMINYIISNHNGKIPEERKQLLKIPGVGDYIADAMTSFVFGGRRTIIDSNVVRLVSRFFGFEKKGEMRRNREFINFCQNLVSGKKHSQIRSFNWGMIDFANEICKINPRCNECQLSLQCNYFKELKLNTDGAGKTEN